jgi:hypothetical protein
MITSHLRSPRHRHIPSNPHPRTPDNSRFRSSATAPRRPGGVRSPLPGQLLRRRTGLLLRLGAGAGAQGSSLQRSPWHLLAPGYWKTEPKSPGGWRLKLVKRPRFRFQGLELGALAQPSGLLRALRHSRWLKVNHDRLEQRRRPWKPLAEPLLRGRTLGRRHFLLPGQRWGQRLSLRSLRHPRRRSPSTSVPLASTLRYRRARQRVYRYMLRLWEDASNYSQARVAMRDFLGELGDEDPASYPWN